MSPLPNDPYCYPGTDILRNLGEIRDRRELENFEADATGVNIIELRRSPSKVPSTPTGCREPTAAFLAMSTRGPTNSARASA
jgi:hypothetical protein